MGISPLRSKVALQHLLGLFTPGVVVAHMPTYASTIDSARFESGHAIVEVPVTEGRFADLFAATRKAAAKAEPKVPVILLLIDPQNPSVRYAGACMFTCFSSLKELFSELGVESGSLIWTRFERVLKSHGNTCFFVRLVERPNRT